MRSRAYRRHQLEKKKKWVEKTFTRYFREFMNGVRVGFTAHTPKSCSCWMCGNQRKYHGDTLQEKRQKDMPRW